MSDAAERHTAGPHILVLVIATAIAQLAMTAFLPALPAMADDLDVGYAAIQLTVPVYLVSVAALQLVIGPLSDRFGRWPVMLGSIGLFLIGTAAAALAPTVGFLLVARVLQGFAIAGVVVSRAVIRDTVGTTEAASKLGYVVMVTAVVPLIAPVLGGAMAETLGYGSARRRL